MADSPSPTQDWLRALQGQFPVYQAFPQDPERNPVDNFIRMLASGTLNIPPSVMAAVQYPMMGGREPVAPPPPTPTAPPALVAPAGVTGPARFPSTQAGPGMGTQVMQFPTPQIPAPPTLAPPPMMGAPAGVDLTAARQFAEAARPAAPNQQLLNDSKVAGILAGLARGAGSVDPASAGSFGRALAMSGGGGAEGMRAGIDKKFEAGQQYGQQTSAYNMARSGQEMQMAKLAADQANAATLVNFENAKSLYQTNVVNDKAMYEHQLQKAGLETPKVTMGAGGTVMIQQQDPKTGQTSVNVIDMKGTTEKLESMSKVLQAANMPGGESIMHEIIARDLKNPYARDLAYRRMAITEVFNAGAGGAVFKDAYTRSLPIAKEELKKEGVTEFSDPKNYPKALQDRLISKILPLAQNNNTWIPKAAPFSFTASVLQQAPEPPKETGGP